jgi:hypothetical protein
MRFRELARYLVEQAGRRPIDGNIKFFWKKLMGETVSREDEGGD